MSDPCGARDVSIDNDASEIDGEREVEGEIDIVVE